MSTPKHSLLTWHRIVGTGLGLAVLGGCSAAENLTAPASTTRMVKPTEVPQVADTAGGDEASEPSDYGQELKDLPMQVWVRRVTFDAAHHNYSITVASAAGSTFRLNEEQPASGSDNLAARDGGCDVRDSKPLTPRIRGAVPSTDTLFNLSCPGETMKLPVLSASVERAPVAGGTTAIIAVGGPEAQGTPDPPSEQGNVDESPVPELSVVSHRLNGKTATIVVWATQGSVLRLEPTNADAAGQIWSRDYQCHVNPTGAHRATTRGAVPQAQYRMRCTNVPAPDKLSVSATLSAGKVGKFPGMASISAPILGPKR